MISWTQCDQLDLITSVKPHMITLQLCCLLICYQDIKEKRIVSGYQEKKDCQEKASIVTDKLHWDEPFSSGQVRSCCNSQLGSVCSGRGNFVAHPRCVNGITVVA